MERRLGCQARLGSSSHTPRGQLALGRPAAPERKEKEPWRALRCTALHCAALQCRLHGSRRSFTSIVTFADWWPSRGLRSWLPSFASSLNPERSPGPRDAMVPYEMVSCPP